MSGYLAGIANQLNAATAMLGRPDDRNSVVFVGPPTYDLIADTPSTGLTRNIHPIGMLANIATQESRQTLTQPAIGMDADITLGTQKGPKVGTISGLTLFIDDVEFKPKGSTMGSETHRTHFLKSLFREVQHSVPQLVELFYKGKHDDSELEPVAFNDTDKWRNFTSQLYSVPIGLYKIERSEGGAILEASYYENVSLEGALRAGIQAGQVGPQFEQFSFRYAKCIPMDPSTDFITKSIIPDGSTAAGGDLTAFTTALRKYLGLDPVSG